MMPVKLEPAAPPSQVKHSTTEPLRSCVLTSGNRDGVAVLGVHLGYEHSSDKAHIQTWTRD